MRVSAKAPTRGFTLIELMITVAIVAILASIAYPSYSRYIVRARRGDVQQVMMSHAQALERYFSSNGTYQAAGGAACGVADPTGTPSNTYYTIGAACNSATTFTITATPVSGKSQSSDGTLTLDNTGLRTGTWSN